MQNMLNNLCNDSMDVSCSVVDEDENDDEDETIQIIPMEAPAPVSSVSSAYTPFTTPMTSATEFQWVFGGIYVLILAMFLTTLLAIILIALCPVIHMLQSLSKLFTKIGEIISNVLGIRGDKDGICCRIYEPAKPYEYKHQHMLVPSRHVVEDQEFNDSIDFSQHSVKSHVSQKRTVMKSYPTQ